MARKTTGRANEAQESSLQTAEQQPTSGAEKLPAEPVEGERIHERAVFRPRVDIYETGSGLVLTADLPGVSPDGLDIRLEKRVLTIHARVDADTLESYSPVYREYEVGDFERSFTLSGDFDEDNIAADLKDGVLRLSIPRAPEPEARRIEVRTR